jgi:hypothetical protein
VTVPTLVLFSSYVHDSVCLNCVLLSSFLFNILKHKFLFHEVTKELHEKKPFSEANGSQLINKFIPPVELERLLRSLQQPVTLLSPELAEYSAHPHTNMYYLMMALRAETCSIIMPQ